MYSRPVSPKRSTRRPPLLTRPPKEPESSESPACKSPIDIRSVSLFVLATVACMFMMK